MGLSKEDLVYRVIRNNNDKFRVNVLIDRCKECRLCVIVCPNKVLVMSEEFNIRGFHYPLPLHMEKCTGCKLCEYSCPDFAIYVEVIKS
ncbi:MAG: 4Fe-4S dicluster domain-containing protein [Desulfurococcaceae archaeon]